jgi:hypothetical protein
MVSATRKKLAAAAEKKIAKRKRLWLNTACVNQIPFGYAIDIVDFPA